MTYYYRYIQSLHTCMGGLNTTLQNFSWGKTTLANVIIILLNFSWCNAAQECFNKILQNCIRVKQH